jgi:hypothetical protein
MHDEIWRIINNVLLFSIGMWYQRWLSRAKKLNDAEFQCFHCGVIIKSDNTEALFIIAKDHRKRHLSEGTGREYTNGHSA